MKVLFAVNNENVSENIMQKYQQDYKQIISAKNVYYFNAIVKELQKDKTYDRIVISEDLEPFSNNNYDTIDKFIFEKLDNISDEATNTSGVNIPIIVIATDRRNYNDELITKMFGIGIYDVLLGQDRSITNVCSLLNKPRTKKEAKSYYKLDADNAGYEAEGATSVSEVEIQNIVSFYKKLGKNEEKYVESFNHIATQYTDSQLRLISKFLPIEVRAVLESSCTKYQEVVSLGGISTSKNTRYMPPKAKNQYNSRKTETKELGILEKNIRQNKITEPVVVPKEIKRNNVEIISNEDRVEEKNKSIKNTTSEMEETKKRGRGRPKKDKVEEIESKEVKETENQKNVEETPKTAATPKKRGRPKKVKPEEENSGEKETKKEVKETESTETLNLFELGNSEDTNMIPGERTNFSDIILPGLDAEGDTNNILPGLTDDILTENVEKDLIESKKDFSDNNENINSNINSNFNANVDYYDSKKEKNGNNQKYNMSDIDLSSLLTREKKLVAFVGTTKNGTSFIINNIAEILSEKGIKTALVDLTKNKNDYYIYTDNQKELRQIATESVGDLKRGIANGIKVNKNLTVFTSLPEDADEYNEYGSILETLLNNYSLILLDCDFETNFGYFKEAQEIYLVQSLDILTIQPLTAFLRELKTKNVLNPDKVRVIVNKMVKVRSLDEKKLIGGMAYYKDPAMSFMTELFNKDTVPYCSIPFEEQAYAKYLEGLVNCNISVKGYSKRFIEKLNILGNMVYSANNTRIKSNNSYNNYNSNGFSNSMNDTLNKMKQTY